MPSWAAWWNLASRQGWGSLLCQVYHAVSTWENTGNTLLSKVSGIFQEAWSVSRLDKDGIRIFHLLNSLTRVFLEITSPCNSLEPTQTLSTRTNVLVQPDPINKHCLLSWASTLHWLRAMTNVSIYRMGPLVTWNQQIFTVLTIYPVLANTGKSLMAWVFTTQYGYNITN